MRRDDVSQTVMGERRGLGGGAGLALRGRGAGKSVLERDGNGGIREGTAGGAVREGGTGGAAGENGNGDVIRGSGAGDAICESENVAVPHRDGGANPKRDEGAVRERDADDVAGDLLCAIPAGWPDRVETGCVALDASKILKAGPRSFALRVRGQSMANAGICDGDVVVGEFTPEARVGAIVVALIDGESTLKRLVRDRGQLYLAAENPNCPNLVPLNELVIQGVVHTVIRRVTSA